MLQKRSFLRLISLMWATMAGRPPTTLRALVGFVRNSGWLSRNPGALCPVKARSLIGVTVEKRNTKEVTKESLQEEISEKENEIKILRKEIKNMEEKEMFAKAASEMKNLKDRFMEAGFTENEAFHMVLELSKTALGIGGMK